MVNKNKKLVDRASDGMDSMLKPARKGRGITLPSDLDALLCRVALARKLNHGQQGGVSGVIESLIEEKRKSLEKEII